MIRWGWGTSPITGGFDSAPATPLSSIGSDESFLTPLSTIGSSDNLAIQDNWLPGIEEVSVQTGEDNDVLAFLVPADGDKQLVDLVNFDAHDAPPLFNPDATGPIDVGGVQLASPQDGALFNDLANALFTGGAADFDNATTLFDDLLGADPSGAASAAADPADVLDAAANDAVAANPDDRPRHLERRPDRPISVLTPSGDSLRTDSSRIRPRSSAVLNSAAISWALRRPLGRSQR